MFTLNRVTTIGLGAGFVLVGCASPVGETEDPTAEASAALTEEAVPEEMAEDAEDVNEAAQEIPAGIASAFEFSNEAVTSEDATEDESADPKSDKWGWGWGAPGLGWGWGGAIVNPGWGWGGAWGSPGIGWGWGRGLGWGWGRGLGWGGWW